jgi:hypothetical protein
LGIPDMNFHYAYPGFRVWGTADMTSWSLERMGGNLATSLSNFSLESFYEFLQVSVSTYTDGFYISLCISRV